MDTFLKQCLIVAAVLGVVAIGVLVGRKYRRRRKRLVYLDQVALIKTGRRAESGQEFANSLYRSINTGTLTVVVSSWHLIETAHTSNINNAIRLADFIDSLKPLWLLERRNIQLLEVEEDFLRFAGVAFDPQPKVTTRSVTG